MSKTLNITVVGHTNTGKTSLIRTLIRDFTFGEVRDAPSTTIDVSEITLHSQMLTLIFSDTPGFEDPLGLADCLDKHWPIDSKLAQTARIHYFLEEAAHFPAFEQEAKILRQLLRSQIALYVIDAREQPLAKYQEELSLLTQCGLPILPVLNFVHASNQRTRHWIEMLKVLGLHHYLSFDTIAPPKERRLYEKIANLLNDYYDSLHAFIAVREAADDRRTQKSYEFIADFLMNISSLVVKCDKDHVVIQGQALLAEKIIQAEQAIVRTLLQHYAFSAEDLMLYPLPMDSLSMHYDFFTTEQLLTFGERFGYGALTGASVGVIADGMTAMTSLGAASVIGGVVGGVSNTLRYYGGRLYDQVTNVETYCVQTPIVLHLLVRVLQLLDHLEGRTHADLTSIQTNLTDKQGDKEIPLSLQQLLMDDINKLRAYPEYSRFNAHFTESKKRLRFSEVLSNKLSDYVGKYH